MPGSFCDQRCFTVGERIAPPDRTTVSDDRSRDGSSGVERLHERTGERVADDHEEVDVLARDELPESRRVEAADRGR